MDEDGKVMDVIDRHFEEKYAEVLLKYALYHAGPPPLSPGPVTELPRSPGAAVASHG